MASYEPPPYSLEYLVAVLKLSSQWDMEGGRRWAIANITQLGSDVPAPLRLRLGRQYNIEPWIKPAIRGLLSFTTTLQMLRLRGSKWLSFEEYEVIACAREGLESERKLLALVPLAIDDHKAADCTNHQECIRVWKAQWRKHIGDVMLHPNWMQALTFLEAETKLHGLHFVGMTPSCREKTRQIIVDSGAFRVESQYIDRVYDKLLAEVPLAILDIQV